MSKTYLFQAILFSQTVLIQTIQCSISMQFSSIPPIDRAYLVRPFNARANLEAMAMKGHSAFLEVPASREPNHYIILCHIQNTRYGRLTPLQRCSQCRLANWIRNIWRHMRKICDYMMGIKNIKKKQ